MLMVGIYIVCLLGSAWSGCATELAAHAIGDTCNL